MSWIRLDKKEMMEMDGKTSIVFLELIMHAAQKGQISASLDMIIMWTSLTERNVRKSLSILEEKRKIKMEKESKKRSKILVVDYEKYILKKEVCHRFVTDSVTDFVTDSVTDFNLANNKNTSIYSDKQQQPVTDSVTDFVTDSVTDLSQISKKNSFEKANVTDSVTDEALITETDANCYDVIKGSSVTDFVTDSDNEPTLFPEKREKKENDTKEKKEKIISKEKETISINRDSKEKEKSAKETENGIKPPDPFDILVDEWVEYRRRIKKTIKTERGLEWIKSRLKNLSKGDLEMARKIIDQSMDHEWQGLFELKEEKNDRKRETRQDLLHNLPTTFVGSSTI